MATVKKKTKESDSGYFHRWGMIQTALWGFSMVITFFLLIFSFLPTGVENSTADPSDSLYATMTFLPLLIFWLWVVIRYKNYRWNWFRTTLVANALLYSGSIIFGTLLPQPGGSSSGIDWVSSFILVILLLSLYIFGKEQFLIRK